MLPEQQLGILAVNQQLLSKRSKGTNMPLEKETICPECKQKTLPVCHQEGNLVTCRNLDCQAIINSDRIRVGYMIKSQPQYDTPKIRYNPVLEKEIKLNPVIELDTTQNRKFKVELNLGELQELIEILKPKIEGSESARKLSRIFENALFERPKPFEKEKIELSKSDIEGIKNNLNTINFSIKNLNSLLENINN